MTQPNFPDPAPGSDPMDGQEREDEPLPQASDDEVLDETARLAREGRRQLDAEEHEPATRPDKPSV